VTGCEQGTRFSEAIREAALRYGLQIVYVFGSRAKEVLDLVQGRIGMLPPGPSDVDIGVKPARDLTVEEKVEIAIFFEDLLDVPRVDVVVLPEAPVFLALAIVTGELLFARDLTHEAEYQLYIMRRAAELLPYEKAKQAMVLGRVGKETENASHEKLGE
jgi:predicted nucleotidyltransferase